jgi:hypothetical protein
MKVIIPLVFEHDAADWASEYDIPESDALADFAQMIANNVGAIPDVLSRNWPAMAGSITAATLETLDRASRDDLLAKLQEISNAALKDALLTEIRRYLTVHASEFDGEMPTWIVFHTTDFDNGHFFTTDADAYFAGGTSVPADFAPEDPSQDSTVENLLTDMYGARGADATLGVDVRAGRIECADHPWHVFTALGIPTGER